LFSSTSFPSFNKAKSTAEEPDLIINSLSTILDFYPDKSEWIKHYFFHRVFKPEETF